MIRWRRPRDNRGIVELVRKELVPISPWQHPKDGRLAVDIARRLRRGATLVASETLRGAPVGFLHMEFRLRTLFIDLLAVHSHHQNRSWGKKLMCQAECIGIAKGCTMARVFVDEENERGIRFYARIGYSQVRAYPALKIVEMTKPLARS